MFDESRAAAKEGCANILFTAPPSSDFFLESPELKEKTTYTSDTRLLRSLPVVDSETGIMPVCRDASTGLHPSEEDEASEVCGGLVSDGDEDDLDAFMGYIDGEYDDYFDDDHLGHTPLPVVNDTTPLCDHHTSKRKRSSKELEHELEHEDEVESKLCKRQKFHHEEGGVTFHAVGSPDVSSNGTGSGVTQPPLAPGDHEDHKSGDGEEFSLEHSTDELQMLCDDFGFEMREQQCSSCSPGGGGGADSISSGSARQSRRRKIRDTVKLLREAIPGGECLDTAIVLDEAINYVKLLQLQVQALGAQRLAQRSAAGR
ncbi:unnamed protein product [Calypogeia fissa]